MHDQAATCTWAFACYVERAVTCAWLSCFVCIVELRHMCFCGAMLVMQQHMFYWDVPCYVFSSALTCALLGFDMCVVELWYVGCWTLTCAVICVVATCALICVVLLRYVVVLPHGNNCAATLAWFCCSVCIILLRYVQVFVEITCVLLCDNVCLNVRSHLHNCAATCA